MRYSIIPFCLFAFLALGCNRSPERQHAHKPDPKPAASPETTYPLQTCVVSGEKLGEHGKPFDYKHEGRLVRVCCEACVDEFKKEPAKFLAKLDAANSKP